ncbi:class I SAM-dependent methyltransferase [Brucella sp. IR073]|uniref:class I SAM-dependent methyltransferase n=1 Tax=unclassified Brucella TaxID=2632610 RepID=UPI003B981A7D
MTADVLPGRGPVIELGPGTGVFTRTMLGRGVDERDLTLIEFDPDFAALLRKRFPSARIINMDAADLTREALYEGPQAQAVVSGLPLLSMPPRKVIAILRGSFYYLKRGGAFYQFTYGPRCPIPRPVLDRLGLKARRIGGTFFNVPPAAVYRISRRGPSQVAH